MNSKSLKSRRNSKEAEPTVHDAVQERIGGRWTQLIGAGQTVCIANNVMLYAVIKNNGPSTVLVSSGYRDSEKLVANVLRVLPVTGLLSLETVDDKYAMVEMEFMPRTR
jgi:hypothetical protein